LALPRQQSSRLVKLATAAAVSLFAQGEPSAHAQIKLTITDDTGTHYICDSAVSDIACRTFSDAMEKLNSNQLQVAIAEFDWVIELYKNFAEAYIGRATAYELLSLKDASQFGAALRNFDQAIAIDPGNLGYIYLRGSFEIDVMKDYKAAIRDFTTVLEKDKTFKDTYFRRGRAEEYSNNFDAAENDLNEAINQDPKNAAYYYELGAVYANDVNKLINMILAHDNFEKAAQYDPNYKNSANIKTAAQLRDETVRPAQEQAKGIEAAINTKRNASPPAPVPAPAGRTTNPNGFPPKFFENLLTPKP
jgi:tetratricopeptide (TPR) repeat protein